jgi:hypothetical protein
MKMGLYELGIAIVVVGSFITFAGFVIMIISKI